MIASRNDPFKDEATSWALKMSFCAEVRFAFVKSLVRRRWRRLLLVQLLRRQADFLHCLAAEPNNRARRVTNIPRGVRNVKITCATNSELVALCALLGTGSSAWPLAGTTCPGRVMASKYSIRWRLAACRHHVPWPRHGLQVLDPLCQRTVGLGFV